MLKNMKLGVKMIGGFLIVAAIIAVVGIVSMNGAGQLNEAVNEIGQVRLPSIEALLESEVFIEEMLVAQRTLMAEFLNYQERARQLGHFQEARNDLYATWEYFKTLPATAEEDRLSDRIDIDLAEWSDHNDQWLLMVDDFEGRGLLDPGALVETFFEARGDYYAIAGNVVEYIAFNEPFEGGESVLETALGRWLRDFETDNSTMIDLQRQFDQPAAAFHTAVREIRELLERGEREQADTLYHNSLLPAELRIFEILYEGVAYANDANEQRDRINTFVMGNLYDEARDVMGLLDELIHINEAIAEAEVEQAEAVGRQVVLTIIIGMIVGTILAIILGLVLTMGITKPIAKGVDFAKRIALGELDIELDVRQKDEVGILSDALREMLEALKYKAELVEKVAGGDLTMEVQVASENDGLGQSLVTMVDSLNDLLSQVNSAVDQVSTGSDQVSQASQSLSQGATEQASSLEEISSSANQINGQSRQNADNATEANTLAKKAADDAGSGNRQMQELVQAMSRINASSDEINKVVKVIDDIAFQINLLALNANVEAARAGKYGKGFAVVAEEVRNLAVRAADAVKETSQMVEESIGNIKQGNGLVDTTAKQLVDITDGAGKVANFLEEIATASTEQAQAIDQITDGLDQIDQVTQANTASAEESASAAEELASQGQQLKAMIARFKLKKAGRQESMYLPDSRGYSDRPQQAAQPRQISGKVQGHPGAAKPAAGKPGAGKPPAGKPQSGRPAAGKPGAPKKEATGIKPVDPSEVIRLDDDEFDRF